jgi:hypothetical protein
MNPDDPKDLLRVLATLALAVTMVCSVTGWAHTVRELNTLTAYQPVGGEALRVSKPVQDFVDHNRLARAGRSAPLPRLQ